MSEDTTKQIKKLEATVKKLSFALKETGLFEDGAIEILHGGRISDAKIAAAIAQAKVDLNPPAPTIPNRYVVGFAFNREGSHILLVWKNRPDWQKGLLNGTGGKIEEGETVIDAMIREFREETGIVTDAIPDEATEDNAPSWHHVGVVKRDAVYDGQPESYELNVLTVELDLAVMKAAQDHVTDEEVICLPYNREIIARRGVPGLAWLTELAFDASVTAKHFVVNEPVVELL